MTEDDDPGTERTMREPSAGRPAAGPLPAPFDAFAARCQAALERSRPYVSHTPCVSSPALEARVGARVFLKLENRQQTGSFKLRGVVNKILALTDAERQRPLVAASSGNHAAAFAHVVALFGLKGRLFLPRTIAPVKRRWLERTGVPLEFVGEDCVETELAARRAAERDGAVLVPPYNDAAVICGQGTIGVELLASLRELDAVFVPVGGGGLISGIAAYVKAVSPGTRVIGCQPARSAVMYHSVQAGRIVEEVSRPTLSDATAGGIEPDSVTLELCRRCVDDFVLIKEEEIEAAIVTLYRHHDMVVEGGAALSVAAAEKLRAQLAGQRVALIVSGGRIEENLVEQMARRRR